MNLKRLFRLAAISGAVAAAVAAYRALTRDQDPLPAPTDSPSEPWPPLRVATNTSEAPSAPAPGAVVAEVPEPAVEEDTTAPGLEPVPEPEPTPEPESAPEPESEIDAADESPAAAGRRRQRPLRATWMPPNDDGSCPDGYPLKANEQSMIFHAPGQMSYDRTVPERCYADAEAAVADGYRAAKR